MTEIVVEDATYKGPGSLVKLNNRTANTILSLQNVKY